MQQHAAATLNVLKGETAQKLFAAIRDGGGPDQGAMLSEIEAMVTGTWSMNIKQWKEYSSATQVPVAAWMMALVESGPTEEKMVLMEKLADLSILLAEEIDEAIINRLDPDFASELLAI